jgi:hypothetical protein
MVPYITSLGCYGCYTVPAGVATGALTALGPPFHSAREQLGATKTRRCPPPATAMPRSSARRQPRLATQVGGFWGPVLHPRRPRVGHEGRLLYGCPPDALSSRCSRLESRGEAGKGAWEAQGANGEGCVWRARLCMRNDTSMAHLASFVKAPNSMELITSRSWAICFQKSLLPMCAGLAEGDGTQILWTPQGSAGRPFPKWKSHMKAVGSPLT